MAEHVSGAGSGAPLGGSSELGPARGSLRVQTAVTNVLVGARFLPVWLATAALFIVAAIVAPEALQSTSWAFVLPYMTVLAVAALGQMLVIMQAGIDLSIAPRAGERSRRDGRGTSGARRFSRRALAVRGGAANSRVGDGHPVGRAAVAVGALRSVQRPR